MRRQKLEKFANEKRRELQQKHGKFKQGKKNKFVAR